MQSSILYVVRNVTGGSIESLMLLLENQDRHRFEPTVLFLQEPGESLSERLAASNIATLVLADRSRAVADQTGKDAKASDRTPMMPRHGLLVDAFRALRVLGRLFWAELPVAVRAYRLTRDLAIDLVHVNMGIRHGKVGVLLAAMLGVPCVVHERMWPVYTAIERVLARRVDRIIHISEAIRDYPGAHVAHGKSTVIHNAVDLDRFRSSETVDIARTEFGWGAEHFVVGVIGRLDSWKGHDYFLTAMREIVDRHPHSRALVIGGREQSPRNRDYADRLDQMKVELDLENEVVFTGQRSDIGRLMADLDAVILPSSEPEPFGRVVIEAMAVGKPVVATAAGGVPEIVDSGRTGLLVPPRDAAKIADAISALIEDASLREAIGREARREVEERFTAEGHVSCVQQVYEDLLQGKRLSKV